MYRNSNNAQIIIGCSYRLSQNKTSSNTFKLLKLSGDGKRVKVCNTNTQAVEFWRSVDDLYWVDSRNNNKLAEEILGGKYVD